jgi:hypothetical protein
MESSEPQRGLNNFKLHFCFVSLKLKKEFLVFDIKLDGLEDEYFFCRISLDFCILDILHC